VCSAVWCGAARWVQGCVVRCGAVRWGGVGSRWLGEWVSVRHGTVHYGYSLTRSLVQNVFQDMFVYHPQY
jgi:hypothetical protein